MRANEKGAPAFRHATKTTANDITPLGIAFLIGTWVIGISYVIFANLGLV